MHFAIGAELSAYMYTVLDSLTSGSHFYIAKPALITSPWLIIHSFIHLFVNDQSFSQNCPSARHSLKRYVSHNLEVLRVRVAFRVQCTRRSERRSSIVQPLQLRELDSALGCIV